MMPATRIPGALRLRTAIIFTIYCVALRVPAFADKGGFSIGAKIDTEYSKDSAAARIRRTTKGPGGAEGNIRIDSDSGIQTGLNEYLKSIGVEARIIDKPLEKVIRTYVHEGYIWFVLNRLRIGPDAISNHALAYTFKAERGFYPLRISKTKRGMTSINLMVLTSGPVEAHAQGYEYPRRMYAPKIDYRTLSGLDSNAFALLAHADSIAFRIWSINDDIRYFHRDFLFGKK